MLVDLQNSNLIIRQWLNGALFPLSVNLSIIIAIFLLQCYVYSLQHDLKFHDIDGVRTACALFWVFMSDAIRAGSVWLLLHIQNAGHSVPIWIEQWSNIAFVITAVMAIVSLLRCTFIFTPPGVRSWYWFYSITSTAGFLYYAHTHPNFPLF